MLASLCIKGFHLEEWFLPESFLKSEISCLRDMKVIACVVQFLFYARLFFHIETYIC